LIYNINNNDQYVTKQNKMLVNLWFC